MNRERKEEIRKYKEARKGLTPEEIVEVDRKEAIEAKIQKLAHELHCKMFSEEYDEMYDSGADANDRRRGINPMSAKYVEKVQARRAKLGVTALGENGLSVSNDSYALCRKIAEQQIKNVEEK